MVAIFAFTLAWAYAVLWYVFLIGIVAPLLDGNWAERR